MPARIISATSIWALVFGASLALSGAPFRVHAVDAVALLIAFWIPALFVRRPKDLVARWMVWIPLVVAGLVFWEVASAEVIAKKDAFDAPLLYVLGIVGMTVLQGLHVTILWGVGRLRSC